MIGNLTGKLTGDVRIWPAYGLPRCSPQAPLYHDVDKEEGDEGSRLRVPMLFAVAACFGMLAELATVSPSNAQEVRPSGVFYRL